MMNQQELLGVPTIRTQNFHLFRHSIGTVGIPANNGHQPLLPINSFPIGQIVEVVCLLCQILCQREGSVARPFQWDFETAEIVEQAEDRIAIEADVSLVESWRDTLVLVREDGIWRPTDSYYAKQE